MQGTEAGVSGRAIEPHSLMVKVRNSLMRVSVEQHSLTVKWGHPEVPELTKTQSSS